MLGRFRADSPLPGARSCQTLARGAFDTTPGVQCSPGEHLSQRGVVPAVFVAPGAQIRDRGAPLDEERSPGERMTPAGCGRGGRGAPREHEPRTRRRPVRWTGRRLVTRRSRQIGRTEAKPANASATTARTRTSASRRGRAVATPTSSPATRLTRVVGDPATRAPWLCVPGSPRVCLFRPTRVGPGRLSPSATTLCPGGAPVHLPTRPIDGPYLGAADPWDPASRGPGNGAATDAAATDAQAGPGSR
jgi:hypothetical protein